LPGQSETHFDQHTFFYILEYLLALVDDCDEIEYYFSWHFIFRAHLYQLVVKLPFNFLISWLAPEEATSLSMKVGQLHTYQICQDGLEVPTGYRVQMIEAKQQFEIGLYGDDFK